MYNVTVCYNGNRQIPMYIHHVKSYTCGIAFSSECDTHATHMFHVYHVELVGDLYHSYILLTSEVDFTVAIALILSSSKTNYYLICNVTFKQCKVISEIRYVCK